MGRKRNMNRTFVESIKLYDATRERGTRHCRENHRSDAALHEFASSETLKRKVSDVTSGASTSEAGNVELEQQKRQTDRQVGCYDIGRLMNSIVTTHWSVPCVNWQMNMKDTCKFRIRSNLIIVWLQFHSK